MLSPGLVNIELKFLLWLLRVLIVVLKLDPYFGNSSV